MIEVMSFINHPDNMLDPTDEYDQMCDDFLTGDIAGISDHNLFQCIAKRWLTPLIESGVTLEEVFKRRVAYYTKPEEIFKSF